MMGDINHNEDEKIRLSVPFLSEGMVLFVEGGSGTSDVLLNIVRKDLPQYLKERGYTLLFLPDLVERLSPELLRYLSPGREDGVSVEDMYRRIREMAGLQGRTGLLYRRNGETRFRAIPDGILEEGAPACQPVHRSGSIRPKGGCWFTTIKAEADESLLERAADEETPLDPRTREIIEAWEEIERKFGITIEDLDILLGYRVRLSRLNITTSGRLLLPDYEGKEVKMDDLTKAVYFFYLRHPEGARLKELQDYGDEILQYYLGITGRDDVEKIQGSVQKLLDPFGNGLNVCFSRIKKAFRDVVGDRIARFYYVDGRYGEPRKIALDRDLVIWDH